MKKTKFITAVTLSLLLVVSLIGCDNNVVDDVAPVGGLEEDDTDIPYEDDNLEEYDEEDDYDYEFDYDCDHNHEYEEIGFDRGFQVPIENLLYGLIEDEYPDLVITVAVLERMAILPGSTVRINVVIENQGDETIAFIKGSGSNIVPDALLMCAGGLQSIAVRAGQGLIATMDFVVETLEPGETVYYDLYVRVIEANENFNAYTFMLTGDENVAEMSWEELNSKFHSLVKAAPGHYTINVFFLYKIVGDDEGDLIDAQATGFNVGTIEITVDDVDDLDD